LKPERKKERKTRKMPIVRLESKAATKKTKDSPTEEMLYKLLQQSLITSVADQACQAAIAMPD
jgi:hypothetical protein